MKKSITMLLLVITIATSAQQKTKNYYIIPQIALLNGDNATSGQVQVIGGMQLQQWAFGLGVAMDYYKIRTLPVFADARLYFGAQKKFFSYANLGYNIVTALESQERKMSSWVNGFYTNSSFNNGLYTDIGIGCSLQEKGSDGVSMSLGYSIKTLSETYTDWVSTSSFWLPQVRVDASRKANYTLNCFTLKLGVRL